MRSSKQRLTLLKGKVIEVIPESDNVFGFEGISKKMILDVIDDTYSIVTLLDDFSGSFEAILVERKISEYFEKASKYLKESFQENKEDFNQFLNILAKLHYRTKEAYISVAKEPIRTESEIKRAKEELAALETGLESIKPVFQEIKQIEVGSKSFIAELEEKHSAAIKNEEEILKSLEEINEQKDETEKTAQQVLIWEENIKNLKEELANKSVLYEELKTKAESLKAEYETSAEKGKKLVEKFERQIKENEAFQSEIQKTIEDANRHGMAGSFKKRKDELRWALLIWGVLTIASIVVLIILSYNILIAIAKDDLTAARIIARVPIFAACVWLGWFCAKQYGFTSRVMEDYSYKYAVSMAFEGYRKATAEVDEELERKLLDMTIYNISNSPLNIYDTKTNDGTPYPELFKSIWKGILRNKEGGEQAGKTHE